MAALPISTEFDPIIRKKWIVADLLDDGSSGAKQPRADAMISSVSGARKRCHPPTLDRRKRLVTEFTMAAASVHFLPFARRGAPRRECGVCRCHLIAGGLRPLAEPCPQETAAIAPTAEVPRALLIFGSGP